MEEVFLYIKMKPSFTWSIKPAVVMAFAWGKIFGRVPGSPKDDRSTVSNLAFI